MSIFSERCVETKGTAHLVVISSNHNMAKSHERVIVDVRDLFGQTKEKIDLPEVNGETQEEQPPKGLFSSSFGNGALGEYKPKACASTSGNDNVFFGAPPPSGSRRKQETRPSALIDVDVGIDEQNIEDDVTPPSPDPPKSDGPWSFGKPASGGRSGGGGGGGGREPQLGPSGGGMVRGVGGSRPAGSATSTSSGVNTNNGPQSAAMNGRGAPPVKRPGNKYEGRPLPAPPTSAAAPTTKPTTTRPTAPPPAPPPPPLPPSSAGGGRAGQDVTSGPMSNFSLGAKKSAAPSQQSNQRPHGRGGSGQGGGGSAKSQTSLDHSSSGVETDDNGTPESTIESRAPRPNDQRPQAPDPQTIAQLLSVGASGQNSAPPPPPPPAPASQGTDSSYHSDDGTDEEEEDEVTLDFDHEDDDDHKKWLYQEYHGDDYGQFLKDDAGADAGEAGVAPRSRKKRQKRRKKKDEAQMPGSTASVSSSENATLKKRTLKGRLKAAFIGISKSGAADGEQPQGPPTGNQVNGGSNIHTFSFADSKIGTSFIQQPGDAADDPVYGSATGSGPPDLAPCDAAYGGDRKWWSTDTLSARTMSNNSDVMLRRPSAHKTLRSSQPTLNPTANGFGDLNGGTGELIDGMDFESHRKSVIYGVHTDRKSQNKSIFRRFKKDEKELVANMIDNTVMNPLAGLETEVNNTHF